MSTYWRLPGRVRMFVVLVPALVFAWMVDESNVGHPLWLGTAGVLLCTIVWAVLEHRHGRPPRQ